jgi:hypothetical protein
MIDFEPVTAASFDVKLLDPSDVCFFHAPEGDARIRLQVLEDRCYIDVKVACALPLSNPEAYLGVRDAQDKDVGLIPNWKSLNPDSLNIINEALERAYFLPKVLKVRDVKESYGVVVWDVETNFGDRRYAVRNMRDNSVTLSAERVLMTDVEGNRFEFTDIYSYNNEALEVLLKVL